MTRFAGGEHEIRVGSAKTNRTLKVQVAEGDVAPWDLDTKFRLVGSDVPRIDAVAKVTGRAKYAYDVRRPGMLHGALLRSPHPKAVVKSVDVSVARTLPGIKAAIALKGPESPFKQSQVRFAGDEIAAVAAETAAQARDALEAIKVEYEVENHNTDPLRADGAPAVDATGQVTTPWPADDKLDPALAAAAKTVTATYRVEVQTHSSLEPHGVVAEFRDGELEVWASTQATFGVRQGLAQVMHIPASKVRVHADFVGGGFGSKFQPGAEGAAAALLSRAANAPVKLMLTRAEEHTCAGNRPGALIQVRAGVDQEGTITAWDYRNWGVPGYTGNGGSSKTTSHYLGKAAVRNKQRDLQTDTDSARAMRAPGWPQGFFASESMLDELAEAIGIDPLALRLRNDTHELRREEWQLGAERFGWAERRNADPRKPRREGRWQYGAGCASALWGQMGGSGNRVTCRIHPDGTVESRNGAQDIGTGMKTVMALLTAEELGIPLEVVKVAMGDTADPVGPASGGSTTTPSLAPTVRLAAAKVKAQLTALVAAHLGVGAEQIQCEGGKIGTPGGKMLEFAQACKLIQPGPLEATAERFDNYAGFQDYVCGCQFAEVRVDPALGIVQVTKMLGVQDCGLVIARKLAESQVLGGMIQGISYALHEQRILDHRAGRMLNADLSSYKITGPIDMPEMDVIMVSVANGKNSVGAAGLGEPPKVGTAGAIANAVANALGARVRALPITPDRVLAALAATGGVK